MRDSGGGGGGGGGSCSVHCFFRLIDFIATATLAISTWYSFF